MFDIGFSELVLVALMALLILGPKRLPEVARAAGMWLGRLRRFVDNVKRDFDRELHSEELTELRKLRQELDDTRRTIEESSSQLFQNLDAELEPDAATIHAAEQGDTGRLIKAADRPATSKKSGKKTRRTKSARKKHARAKKSRKR